MNCLSVSGQILISIEDSTSLQTGLIQLF